MLNDTTFEVGAWVLAAALGAFIGYGDLHTDDTGIIAGLIVASAFVLGLLRPVHAWRWPLILALAILGAEVYSYYAVAPRSGLKTVASFAALFAFVTAIGLAGAYLGVGARKLGGSAFGASARG